MQIPAFLSYPTIVGILFIIVSGFLGNYATEQIGRWTNMWQQVDPNLDAGPPPIEGVRQGVVGCFLGIPARFLQWFCLFLGIALILTQGNIISWLQSAVSWVGNIY